MIVIFLPLFSSLSLAAADFRIQQQTHLTKSLFWCSRKPPKRQPPPAGRPWFWIWLHSLDWSTLPGLLPCYCWSWGSVFTCRISTGTLWITWPAGSFIHVLDAKAGTLLKGTADRHDGTDPSNRWTASGHQTRADPLTPGAAADNSELHNVWQTSS